MTHNPGQASGRAERLAGWFEDCDAVVYGQRTSRRSRGTVTSGS